MGKVTLITAFFDVGRKNWDKKMKCDNNKYFGYFEHWSNLQNDLIVYVDDLDIKHRVEELRKKIIGCQTKVVYIKDIRTINEELYESLVHSKFELSNNYRLLPKNPECVNVLYNYVMTLKLEVMRSAIDKFQLEGNVAWIDFGFDHGGVLYDKHFFDRQIKYKENKISLFSLVPIDVLKSVSIVDTIMKMETYIQGSFFVGPVDLIRILINDAVKAQKTLNDINLMDDDQILYLMAYRKRPEIYDVVYLPQWHSCLYYLEEGKVLQQEHTKNIARKIKRIWKKLKYAIRVFKHMLRFDWPK